MARKEENIVEVLKLPSLKLVSHQVIDESDRLNSKGKWSLLQFIGEEAVAVTIRILNSDLDKLNLNFLRNKVYEAEIK